MMNTVVGALASVLVANPVHAQSNPTTEAAQSGPSTDSSSPAQGDSPVVAGADAENSEAAIGDIVVTARSRAESLQTVPLAVTAFSADALAERGIQDLKDVGLFTPGLSYENYSGGFGSPVVRGTASLFGALESSVATFYDGLYLPRTYMTDLGFTDIERIEVVRGPQSARYGRNAFMGAINYVPKRPTEALEADLSGTIGTDSRYDASAMVSGAVVPDRIRLLGNVSYSTFGGSWKNTHPFCDIDFKKGTDCSLGGWRRLAYNLAARILPTDSVTIDASYRHYDDKEEGFAQNFFGELNADTQLLNCGATRAGTTFRRLFCGTIPVRNIPIDPRSFSRQVKVDVYRGSVNARLSDAIELNYIFGRITSNNNTFGYKDLLPGCPFFIPGRCVFESAPIGKVKSTSHEARISFDDDGPLKLAFGGFYSSLDDRVTSNFGTLLPLTGVPTGPIDNRNPAAFFLFVTISNLRTQSKILSPFAEVNLSLMDDRLRLGLEGRYSSEEKAQTNLVNGRRLATTFRAFTPRATVDFKVTPRNLLFASVGKGVKSGGFNAAATLLENRTYGQESNITYEIGSKNSFLNGALQLNLTAYYVKWSDLQIFSQDIGNPSPLPVNIIRNLGNVTSKGVELDGVFKPFRQLTTYFTASMADATYDEGTVDLRWGRVPPVCDNIVCNANGDIGGNQVERAPKWQGTFGAEFRETIGGAGDLDFFVRGDAAYQSRLPADAVNLSFVHPRTIVNGAIGFEYGNYEVRFWGRNIFDKKYVSSAIIAQPNTQYNAYLGERRTLGLTVSAKIR